jgi:predicted metal-binding membrane protein
MPRLDLRQTSPVRTDPPARLPARERLIVWAGILTVTAISWFVLARMSIPAAGIGVGSMAGMTSTMGRGVVTRSLNDVPLIFAMWTVMMAAMMLPSASPTIEMYGRIARSRSSERVGRAGLFVVGYLIAWAGFSAAITLVQYVLERVGIVADAMRMEPLAGGLLLIAAGIYQFTPLKQACLTQCRSPLGFFMTKWRSGRGGAFTMGLDNGVFCVGCCWLLMALMFVAGVMNLLWAAALTIFVLLEKATPWGSAVARISGALMMVSGMALAAFG